MALADVDMKSHGLRENTELCNVQGTPEDDITLSCDKFEDFDDCVDCK